MAKEVTSPKSNSVATTGVDDDLFGAHAGAGLENVGETDVLIPRLTIIQGLSPQLKRGTTEYIEGAKIGDIVDVGTREIFTDPILFLPVHFSKVFIEWAPRSRGGGLVAIHDDPIVMESLTQKNEDGKAVNAAGNTISETSQFFGYNLASNRQKCFIAFSSTQLKKGRMWNTLAMKEKVLRGDGTEFTPPLYYRAYVLGSANESNNKGDWEGWTINRGPKMTELEGYDIKELFNGAVAFQDSLLKGEIRADMSDEENAAEVNSNDGAM